MESKFVKRGTSDKQSGSQKEALKKVSDSARPFSKVNFWMMGGCLLLIVLGFILMSGGGSQDGTTFNPEIFSTRRIVVGPLLSFLGFLFMAFAIVWNPSFRKDGRKS